MTPADNVAAIACSTRVSGLRRWLASALASGYGVLLLILWTAPLNVIAKETIEDSPALGWTGVGAALVGFLSFLLLPKSYYVIRPLERSGRIYRALGVKQFRYVVGLGDGISQLAKRIDPHFQNPLARMSYSDRVAWHRISEGVHWGFLFGSIPLIALAFYQGWDFVGWTYVALHIPISAYPIILQRYARAQLERIGAEGLNRRGK